MPNPYSLTIDGVDSGANLLDFPSGTGSTTPYVDISTLNLQMSGDGGGGSMSFDVVQNKTPSGTTPWWRSGGVNDLARVRFFDSRYSATVPVFLGFITSIDAKLLANGLGTRASVSVSDADAWLDKTIVRRGSSGVTSANTNLNTWAADEWGFGDANTTDRDAINQILSRVHSQVNDATTRQLLDTSIISGSTRAIYSGTARTIGRQSFKAGNLRSALDQIAEAASGVAGVAYRYYIDGSARLNYGPIVAAPTYADAPFEIVIDPASVNINGSGGTATSKILGKNLSVTLNHDRIVRGIFVPAINALAQYDKNSSGTRAADYYFRSYGGTAPLNGAGLSPARTGPIPMEVISAPKVQGGARGQALGDLAKATMQSRGKPVRTVSFEVYGVDSGYTSNPDLTYGLVQGYKQTGVSTYELVTQWQAGQYVKINAPALDLSNVILRIASLSMSFPDGSFIPRISVQAEFRRSPLKGIKFITGGEV